MTWEYAWRWRYAWQWDDLLREPVDPLTEEEARARHESGESYTAYHLDEDGVIDAAVEVRLGNGYVGIKSFDRYARLVCHQVLDQHGDGMFMRDASWYGYGDSTEHLVCDEAREFLHVSLKSDGAGREHRDAREGPDAGWPASAAEGGSLDELWAPVPEFGDYMRVCLVGVDREHAAEVMREYEREKRLRACQDRRD